MGFNLSILLLAAQLDPSALVPLYRQALALREKQFGPDHPKVAQSLSDLGLYLRGLGDRAGAADNLARALDIHEKALDAKDPITAQDMENLASVVPPEAAIKLHRRAADCTDPAISARNWGKLGDLYAARDDRTTAADAYRKAIAKEETASGGDDPRVAVRLNDLGQVLEPKEAEAIVRRALAIERKSPGSAHPAFGITLNNLANILLALGRVREAEVEARNSLRVLEASLGPNHPKVAVISSNLAEILMQLGEKREAQRLLKRAAALSAEK